MKLVQKYVPGVIEKVIDILEQTYPLLR